MFKKIKNFIEWGVFDLNEIVENKEIFTYFYIDDDIDYSNIKC